MSFTLHERHCEPPCGFTRPVFPDDPSLRPAPCDPLTSDPQPGWSSGLQAVPAHCRRGLPRPRLRRDRRRRPLLPARRRDAAPSPRHAARLPQLGGLDRPARRGALGGAARVGRGDAPELRVAAPAVRRAGRRRRRHRRTGRPATCSRCPTTWSTPAASSAASPRARRLLGDRPGDRRSSCSTPRSPSGGATRSPSSPTTEWIRPEAIRLDELRLVAVEARVDAELRVGHHQEVVGQLEALTRRAPAARAVRPAADARPLPVGPAGRGAAGRAGLPHHAARRPRPRAVGRPPRRSRPRSSRSATTSRGCAPAAPRARRRDAVDAASRRCPRRRRRSSAASATSSSSTRLFETGRILTLFGPGGVGKTRLAHRLANTVAPTFADGVRLVELGPVRDEGAVTAAVAGCARRAATAAAVARRLDRRACSRRSRLLLVLDNCEHVLDTTSELVELVLQWCPQRAGARHQPRAARHPGRGRVVGAAAAGAERRRPAAGRPRRRSPRCSCSWTGPRAAQADFELDDGNRARRRRALHPARRRAARARAGRGAHAVDEPGRAGGTPPRAVPGARRLAARHRSPAPHAARPRAVVVRPADAARAAPVRPAVDVRRELRARAGRAGVRGRRHRRARRRRAARRAGRQVDARDAAVGIARALPAARDAARVRPRAARRRHPSTTAVARRPRRRARRAGRRRRPAGSAVPTKPQWMAELDATLRRPARGARRRRRRRRRRPARCGIVVGLREYAWRRIRYELLTWADATVAMPGAAEHPLYPDRARRRRRTGASCAASSTARSRSAKHAMAAAERLGVGHRRPRRTGDRQRALLPAARGRGDPADGAT